MLGRKFNFHGGETGTSCPESWWTPHPWKDEKWGWAGLWTAWSGWRCPSSLQGDALDDLQRFFQTNGSMIPFNTGQICPFTSQLQIMRKAGRDRKSSVPTTFTVALLPLGSLWLSLPVLISSVFWTMLRQETNSPICCCKAWTEMQEQFPCLKYSSPIWGRTVAPCALWE